MIATDAIVTVASRLPNEDRALFQHEMVGGLDLQC